MKNRGILITCAVLLLAACLLIGCAATIAGGYYLWNADSSAYSEELVETPSLESNVSAQVTETPELTPTIEAAKEENSSSEPTEAAPTDPSPAGAAISVDVARQMDEIQMQVILERGLKPTENVNRGLYSPEQLRQRVLDDFLADTTPEESRDDARVLAAFGLLDPDFDLNTFYTDLLSEQVAGFYDQDTKEMIVVQGEDFGGPERLTYAHEYTHALQDQNYDIENGLNFNDEACENDSEKCAAIQALIEGDASLSELNWFLNNGTAQDQSEIMEFYNTIEMPVFNTAPEFITMDFTFPYESGLAFVQYLYDRGGWGTVNRAYANLPQSTEQILHPERYPDDQPLAVNLPDLAGSLVGNWEEIDRGTMGEWYTYLILAKGLDTQARLDDETARTAAEGWGGDAYVVYFNESTQKTVMVLQTTWDTHQDADEFAAAFNEYLQGRFGATGDQTWQGDDGYHTFFQEDGTTTWVLAPDAETLAAVRQAIP